MKVSAILGRTVIAVPAGDIIGSIEDVLVHSGDQCVGAIVIKSALFPGLQIVLAQDVTSIGDDAVAISGVDKLRDQTRFGESNQMMSVVEASGRQVTTESGNFVGKLSDIHIDPETRRVTGFEVTGGVVARLFGHTHTIALVGHTRLGKDLLVVSDEAVSPPKGTQL